MVVKRGWLWIALLATAPSAVLGQTQAEQDRLDTAAKFVVTAPMCELLGMVVDPELPVKADEALIGEAASWQMDLELLKQLKDQAFARQSRMLGTDLEAAAAAAKTDAELRNIRNVLRGYARTCESATGDPIFSQLIKLPAGWELETAITTASDKMLEGGGLASWQTPAIQARGDLMMLAGTCRAKIGPSRSDALVAEYGKSDDVRERAYYRRSFDDGLADQTIIETLDGCNRAIQRFRAKAR